MSRLYGLMMHIGKPPVGQSRTARSLVRWSYGDGEGGRRRWSIEPRAGGRSSPGWKACVGSALASGPVRSPNSPPGRKPACGR